jgi:pyridoxamine 5'-phosphate oxidase
VTSPHAPTLLTAELLGSDPILTFNAWLAEAEMASGMRYPNAVTLSTVDAQGNPDGRIVLLKGTDARGFQFFTNYDSRKGAALTATPRAALTFYWDAQGRQIRARGAVVRLPESESDAYFASRPRASRIGAWASRQSEAIDSRDALDAAYAEEEERFADLDVPRPPHWGGFVLSPTEVEFWQEVPFRLHDRFLFRKGEDGTWAPPTRISP